MHNQHTLWLLLDVVIGIVADARSIHVVGELAVLVCIVLANSHPIHVVTDPVCACLYCGD
jgi:hypothetical protein